VGAVVFLLAILFGQILLETIGGADFGRAYTSLLWLTAAACTDLAIVAFEPTIMAAQRSHLLFLARLAATALLIVCAFLLDPIMGADGVAAAVLANSIGQALLLGAIISRIMRRREQAVIPSA
jgi:O-antigen/teichoic acid export membrane protein